MTIRLITADAVTLVRMGYSAACAAYPDISLIGQASSGAQLLELISTLDPHVVTVDADLTDSNGIDLAGGLRVEHPGLGVVLTGPTDDRPLFAALQAGLSGYVPRTAPVELLMSAVRHAAAAPNSFTALNLADALARRHTRAAALSPRESEILHQMNTGGSLAVIASRMNLTESTVRTYVARISDKLGVHTRTQLLRTAAAHHLI